MTNTTPELNTGIRLRSQVCTTELIVVRADPEVELTCGGRSLLDVKAAVDSLIEPTDADLMTGTQLGKRYVSPTAGSLELLVTKAGDGTLADRGTPLVVKESKALPSSD